MKKTLERARCRPCFACGASGMSCGVEGQDQTERHGLLRVPEEFAKRMDPNVVAPGDDPEGKARAEAHLLSTLWKLQLDMLHRLDALNSKEDGETGCDEQAKERMRALMLEGAEEVARTVRRLTRGSEPLMPGVARLNIYEVAEQFGCDSLTPEEIEADRAMGLDCEGCGGMLEADYAELDQAVCKEFRRRYGREPEVASVIVKGKEVKAHLFFETERAFIAEWLDDWEEAGKRHGE